MARLGQLIKKLEIGTDTAVDFLKSNGCEIKNDLNAKLDPHQEELLINKFASDEVKAELAAKKQKHDTKTDVKPEKEEVKHHTFNVVGKIDLDSVNKPASKKNVDDDTTLNNSNSANKNEEPTAESKKVEPKPVEEKVVDTPIVETKSNPIPVVETVDKNEVKSEPKAEIISQNKPEEKFEKKNIEVTEKNIETKKKRNN